MQRLQHVVNYVKLDSGWRPSSLVGGDAGNIIGRKQRILTYVWLSSFRQKHSLNKPSFFFLAAQFWKRTCILILTMATNYNRQNVFGAIKYR